jgi:pyruvate-formate lyase
MDEVVLLYGHSDLAKYQSYVEDVIRHAGELLAECNSKEERASQEKRRKAIAKLERLSRLGVNRPAGRQSFWERLRKVYSIWSK